MILVGDCLEKMREMEDGSFDLIFTSPPYNMREKGHKGSFPEGGIWGKAKIADGYPAYSDDLSYEDYREWQRECLKEMWRLTADNGAIFYNHKPRIKRGLLWHPLELNPGLPLRQIIIWDRGTGMNFHPSACVNSHEYILMFAKPKFRVAAGQRGIRDVWRHGYAKDNDHPAPFPVELPAKALQLSGAKNVLDPFAGSGTTGVAAKQAGASFTGIELDANFAAKAEARIASS